MIVITGWPGNRSDFVAGWLSTVDPDKFLNLEWALYPGWGKSIIQPVWLWNNINDIQCDEHAFDESRLDNTRNFLNSVIEKQYDARAAIAVTKSHVTSFYAHQLIPPEHLDKFCFVDILVNDSASSIQVAWEEFVKNILFLYSKGRQDIAIAKQMLRCYTDQITGNDRLDVENYYGVFCQKIKSPLEIESRKNIVKFNRSCDSSGAVNRLSIDYRDLMTPNGCDVILDYLNIKNSSALPGWQTLLPLAQSNDRHWCLGRWWQRP